ncbi:MAG: hypothetical protein WCB01_02815 [Candidatus Cybelea sp.]
MKNLGSACYPLGISVAAAFLAGCGGTASSLAVPAGSVPPNAVTSMSSAAYIYATDFDTNSHAELVLLTYPGGTRLGQTDLNKAMGECIDTAGHVFVTGGSSDQIYEYADGGLSPITTLKDPNGAAYACSVDPKTGNLAVADGNYDDPGGVEIYKQAKGKPSFIAASGYYLMNCAYDPAGNLYLTAWWGNLSSRETGLLVLPAGGKKFELMSTDVKLNSEPWWWPSVQWVGNHLVVSAQVSNSSKDILVLYRLSVKGKNATSDHATQLINPRGGGPVGQVWVQGNRVMTYTYHGVTGHIAFWAYPKGGAPLRKTRGYALECCAVSNLWGLVVTPGS